MKKSIFAIIVFFISAISLSAQDIDAVFLSMPENFILGLNTMQKDKLVANPADTAKVLVDRENVFGAVERLAISSDYISIKTSEAGMTQIKLLPLVNDSKIVCVVRTVCSKVCDSQIQFYTTKWIPIPQADLFPKKDNNWFVKDGVDKNSAEYKNAYTNLAVMNPMKITLSPANTSLTVESGIKDYVSVEEYKQVELFFTNAPKVFTWDKVSYK